MTKKVMKLPLRSTVQHLESADRVKYESLWAEYAELLIAPLVRALDNKKDTLLKTILSSEASNKQLTDARAEMRAINSLLALIVGERG